MLLREKTDSRAGTGRYKMSQEHFIMPGSKEVQKKEKEIKRGKGKDREKRKGNRNMTMECMSKGHRNQLKVPNGQS